MPNLTPVVQHNHLFINPVSFWNTKQNIHITKICITIFLSTFLHFQNKYLWKGQSSTIHTLLSIFESHKTWTKFSPAIPKIYKTFYNRKCPKILLEQKDTRLRQTSFRDSQIANSGPWGLNQIKSLDHKNHKTENGKLIPRHIQQGDACEIQPVHTEWQQLQSLWSSFILPFSRSTLNRQQ